MNSRTNFCGMSHSLRMLSMVLACGLCAYAPYVTAQSAYPSKPIRLIIPFPAGGASDVVARVILQRVSDKFGQN